MAAEDWFDPGDATWDVFDTEIDDTIEAELRNGNWLAADWSRIPIVDMSDQHIHAAIARVRRGSMRIPYEEIGLPALVAERERRQAASLWMRPRLTALGKALKSLTGE